MTLTRWVNRKCKNPLLTIRVINRKNNVGPRGMEKG